MGESPNDPLAPQSLQQQHYKLAMLYYGFFVVASAALVLAIYHCLIIKWCADDRSAWPGPRGGPTAQSSGAQKTVELAANTYKYSKGNELEECVVCLSLFEEGEDVKEMPRCKHSFHAPCIDTWLSSHLDCPLCRAPVVAPPPDILIGRFSESALPV